MPADALRQPYLCANASGVLVHDPPRGSLGRVRVLVPPSRSTAKQELHRAQRGC